MMPNCLLLDGEEAGAVAGVDPDFADFLFGVAEAHGAAVEEEAGGGGDHFNEGADFVVEFAGVVLTIEVKGQGFKRFDGHFSLGVQSRI